MTRSQEPADKGPVADIGEASEAMDEARLRL